MGGLLHLVQRGVDWAGLQPAQAFPRCTKCNSQPIIGQCTNHRNVVQWSVALRFNLPVKGLRPVYSDATQLDVELSCVAINGPLLNRRLNFSATFFCIIS